MERYYLMNEDQRVMEFEHELTDLGNVYKIKEIYAAGILPLEFRANLDEITLADWIARRTIPVNRHHVEAILGAVNLEDKFDILKYCHGLSLNDTFWVQAEYENLDFEKINLYDNPFDEGLAWIAFTGLPSSISRHLSTPELTTEGMLPKYWQRTANDITLCKGGTSGYSNAGYEPFNEVIAYLVAKHWRINVISSHLESRSKKPVSISKLFTSRGLVLLPANRYLAYKRPVTRYISLSDAITFMQQDLGNLRPFYDMCFLDYIIENGDRHLSNWGFLIDNKTQDIADFAPIWDNGCSLNLEMAPDLRVRFDFSSFGIRYDFVKSCEYRHEYASLCNSLVVRINTNDFQNECMEAVKGWEHYEKRVEPVAQFLKNRCINYLGENVGKLDIF